MNILLCFDDNDWNYTRHAAVTMLSLLETNKKHKIKIYIMSSTLSQENREELKRIVDIYNQEIEFIIREDIVDEELKKIIINKRSLSRWARYRLFFPKYIKWIDRILYMDCDVLVEKDIANIYNANMHWKSIMWYYDIMPFAYKEKAFEVNDYINSWVLLFDAKKYNMSKINTKKMLEINKVYWKYFDWADQDKINIIFKDDIIIGKRWMNYQVRNKYFNNWVDTAEIVHCIEKPYVQYASLPKKFINQYYQYLSLTKRKWFPEKKANYWYLKYVYICFYKFCYNLLVLILWEKLIKKINIFKRKCKNFR